MPPDQPQTDPQRADTLRALRQICRNVVHPVDARSSSRISLGIPALDALLPDRGVEPGSLIEWLAPVEGSGAAIIALQNVRWALERRLVWAVVDIAGEFHPPAANGWGIPLESLLLLRPSSLADALWTMEQCLRCSAVGVTWFSSPQLADRVIQRWKRAAEVGGGLGVLFRPLEVSRQSSWADVRWSVRPQTAANSAGRIVRVELVSCRGSFTGGSLNLELHDATGDVCVVPSMAGAATAIRAAPA